MNRRWFWNVKFEMCCEKGETSVGFSRKDRLGYSKHVIFEEEVGCNQDEFSCKISSFLELSNQNYLSRGGLVTRYLLKLAVVF